ncbi:MAG: tetratricopeptide repeat protein [Ignavibacteria bacterium]|nr:tetratricopeptide repeat protein [Ignavibacteria bacterium]MBT8382511.1 tetratricopeptide repeat protein [Ignavibacteria bacterium]MBT8392518.1 tetratricopeptide repeat protein [Ignavibacteria bacterium]NNJ52073.1 tetratricopeptide repeat protein [Ignavibacteriaceae bacterium]NNL19878.1 tetratricopeptide repeat protein [Ignavibacteriaceae bacterium]
MKNFCSECGNKLENQHKFCPNCGTEVAIKTNDAKQDTVSGLDKLLVCDICGEDNPITNEACFSCGAKLKSFIVEKKIEESKKSRRLGTSKQNLRKKNSKKTDLSKNGKDLGGKKLFLVSSIIVIVLAVLLILTGVFDSGINQTQQQISDQSTDSGVDLSNLNMIADLENKVKTNPNDKASTIQLANLLQDSGLYERAIGYYKKYLEMDPEDANAMVDMGICYYNLKDLQTAIKEMETALKYQPKHQLAHLNLGIVNLTAGNLDLSKEWFRKAVQIDPNTQAGKRAQELLQSH